MDWYEENIEEGIRPIVKLLRDNGINTTYSCQVAMVVEAECYSDTDLLKVYNLLVENGYDGFILKSIMHKERGQMLKWHLYLHFPYTSDMGDNDE